MARIRPMTPALTVAQVRDYVLTMLESLSSLAETVDDLHTRDRVRDLADHLMTSWTPKAEAQLRKNFGRLDRLAAAHAAEHPGAAAAALGEPSAGTADEPSGDGVEDRPARLA